MPVLRQITVPRNGLVVPDRRKCPAVSVLADDGEAREIEMSVLVRLRRREQGVALDDAHIAAQGGRGLQPQGEVGSPAGIGRNLQSSLPIGAEQLLRARRLWRVRRQIDGRREQHRTYL